MLGGVFSCTVFPPVVLGSKGLDGEGWALRSVWTDGGYDVHRRRLKAHLIIVSFFFKDSACVFFLQGFPGYFGTPGSEGAQGQKV